MKYIILSVLALFCSAARSQTVVKLGPTEQKVNDAICECLTNQDLSKITTREDAASMLNGCILQKPQLIVDLAAERKIDLNDVKAMTTLGEEVGENLVLQGCLAAKQLFIKISGGASDNTKVVKHTGQDSIYAVKVKQDAEKIVKGIFNGDFETALKYTYPEALKMAGGKNMMIETIKKTMDEFKSKGITFKNGVIGEPGEFIKAKGKIFSIVPEEIYLNVNGKTLYSKSALLAISLDNGLNWYFIDAAGLTDEKVHDLFPEANHKLILPKKNQPVLLD
ncbi:hypothetical protein ACFQZS_00455 [Mucilaginibacter calamicampi]|uniref:Uncharacterized protein n=1 Tax=Mucilaginibacter calamicampi TaxID=1302352 RepID=A0ABW2YRJ0_9SPHI